MQNGTKIRTWFRLVHTMHYRAGSEPRPCAACCAGEQTGRQTGRGETQTLPRMVPSRCRAMIAACWPTWRGRAGRHRQHKAPAPPRRPWSISRQAP
eukprot:scaffold22080_cov125-Isochrysis_galbana.AAC.4